jgi:tetratricopeptide (TPR) repeat protein
VWVLGGGSGGGGRAAAGPPPRDAKALLSLAHAHYLRGELDAAWRLVENADALEPGNAYAAFLAGVIAEQRLELLVALDRYRECLARDVSFVAAAERLGAVEGRLVELERFAGIEDRLEIGLLVALAGWAAVAVVALRRRGG